MVALPGFVGPSYSGTNILADPEELINWYIERVDSPTPSNQAVYYPTPGFHTRITVPESPGRALFHVPASTRSAERGFFVAGAALYELFADFTITKRGTLSAVGGDPATISYNGDGGGQLLITSGSVGESYDLNTNTLTVVSGLAAFQGAMLNGYGLALDRDTSTLRLSDLLDLSAWDPTQFAQRSIAPDPWKAMIVLYPRIYLFGSQTTEVWYDAGAFPFPFQPVHGVLIQEGIEAPYSVAVVSNSLYWLASTNDGNGKVVRTSGYRPETVSTKAVEQAIASYAHNGRIDDAKAWTYQMDGHEFFALNFPSAKVTWCFDTGLPPEQGWHKRGDWDSERATFTSLPVQDHAFVFGKHLVVSNTVGVVSEMRNTYSTANTRRVRRTPLVSQEQQWLFFSKLEIFLESGLGLSTGQGSDPQVMLRTSDDGGKTWSDEHWVSAGKQGAYHARVIWRRLGRSRRRVFELTVSDAIPWRLVNAFLDVTPQVGRS